MSSSTSNSRKIYFKIIAAITLSMLAVVIITRLFTQLQGATASQIIGRVVEARAALPKITQEQKPLVMVYGSSMVHAGFSARQFDRELAERGKSVKSFNFGFGGLNPFYQDYLSRRINEAFIEDKRRLKLAIIEFNPFQATQTRWNRAKFTVDSYLTMLASDRELLQIMTDDLERGIRLFTIKYLRNNISAEMITSYYGRALFPAQRPQREKEPDEVISQRRDLGKELGELFEKEYPDFKDENWSYAWQGAGTIPEERSEHTLQVFKAYYQNLQTEARQKNDRLSRIRSADIEELNFDPLMIQSFINIVKNFQQISDKVEVVLLPKNSKWIHYSKPARQRLNNAIKQIEQATGLTLVNHQDIPEITPEMYSDTTHLSRYTGDVTYTHYLVEQYAKDL